MYGKSEWKIEGMNSKMNYLHECCILLMEKSENLNSQTSVGISSGLDAVKSQNFSIFTGTTVDTAVGNLMNFVNWNETGLLKTRFLETLRLGEDKVKLDCSLFSFNLFVKLFYFFFYFATLLTYWNCSVPLQHRHDIFEFIVTFVKTSTLR